MVRIGVNNDTGELFVYCKNILEALDAKDVDYRCRNEFRTVHDFIEYVKEVRKYLENNQENEI